MRIFDQKSARRGEAIGIANGGRAPNREGCVLTESLPQDAPHNPYTDCTQPVHREVCPC